MKRISMMLLGALLVLLGNAALAQVQPAPSLLNFQGRLARPNGTPVSDGTYSIQFSLWSAATAGTQRWSQTVAGVQVKNGTFGVLLDVSTGFLNGATAGTLFANNLWLDTKIGSDPALTPRQQVVSAAFALKANTVPDNAITAAKIASNAVTNAKIQSVDWAKITGVPVDSLALPFLGTGTASTPNYLFSITNSGSGNGLYSESPAGAGVYGKSTNYIGVFGESTNGSGVYGAASNSTGVSGVSGTFYGLYGYSNSGQGVHGESNGSHGIYGKTQSASGGGVVGENNTAYAVLAGPGYGVYGRTTTGAGGSFLSSGGDGVAAVSTASNGNGIVGDCNVGASAYGVWGRSSTGWGVRSTGPAGGTTGWSNLSDVRYKKNIVPLSNALDTILQMRGVSFDWKTDEYPNMYFSKGRQIGFIAQEVEKLLPQLVLTDGTGYKSVTYSNTVPVLVEAVKTLNNKVETLKSENAELKARLDAIEAALKINK